jgi:hypothetical protein
MAGVEKGYLDDEMHLDRAVKTLACTEVAALHAPLKSLLYRRRQAQYG